MSREQPKTIKECSIIIKRCRRQITQATGMQEACRLIRVGETVDEVEASAYEYKRKYNARLNEVLAIRERLTAEQMEDDYE